MLKYVKENNIPGIPAATLIPAPVQTQIFLNQLRFKLLIKYS